MAYFRENDGKLRLIDGVELQQYLAEKEAEESLARSLSLLGMSSDDEIDDPRPRQWYTGPPKNETIQKLPAAVTFKPPIETGPPKYDEMIPKPPAADSFKMSESPPMFTSSPLGRPSAVHHFRFQVNICFFSRSLFLKAKV